jgi:hypothetical protein
MYVACLCARHSLFPLFEFRRTDHASFSYVFHFSLTASAAAAAAAAAAATTAASANLPGAAPSPFAKLPRCADDQSLRARPAAWEAGGAEELDGMRWGGGGVAWVLDIGAGGTHPNASHMSSASSGQLQSLQQVPASSLVSASASASGAAAPSSSSQLQFPAPPGPSLASTAPAVAQYNPVTAAIISCAAPHYPIDERGSSSSGGGSKYSVAYSRSGSGAAYAPAAVAPPQKSVKFFDLVMQSRAESSSSSALAPLSSSAAASKQFTSSSCAASLQSQPDARENSGRVFERSAISSGGDADTESVIEFWQKRLASYRGCAAGGGGRVILPEPLDL